MYLRQAADVAGCPEARSLPSVVVFISSALVNGKEDESEKKMQAAACSMFPSIL